MNLSFKEKSVWISLVVTLLLFGYYFIRVISEGNISAPNSSLLNLFSIIVVLIIVIQITLQIIIAILHRKEAGKGEDEREYLIELKATKISYFIIAFGVWIGTLSLFLNLSAFVIANIIMFFFVLSEIVGFALQLYYYKRGF